MKLRHSRLLDNVQDIASSLEPICIGAYEVGGGSPPLIVAEMSGNHNQSYERALAIIDAAAQAGVHALKLQTYTADTITLDVRARGFLIEDPHSLWHGKTLYELYRSASTPWEWHERLFERCRQRGLLAFSTPFDATAVDFLESLEVPCYKIASFENVDHALVRKVAQTGKPVLISTGMASLEELSETVAVAREAGCRDLVLMKCCSSYPADPGDLNLASLPHMRRTFQCPVGLSDHTLGIGAAVASVAFGAVAIEKHLTISRRERGVDSAFSMEPEEMRALVRESERAWRALGKLQYGPTERERASMQFRRSLYVVEDMKAGEVFTERNVKSIRPGLGLPPKHLRELLGRRVRQRVVRGTPVSWELTES